MTKRLPIYLSEDETTNLLIAVQSQPAYIKGKLDEQTEEALRDLIEEFRVDTDAS